MTTINLENLDQEVYKETLNNGLNIYLIPFKNKKNYYITYATYFGSDVLEFVDDYNSSYKPPQGVAHFLEHKMFESEDGIDPFTYFSKSGTESNASTSFDNTKYICYGTKNFKNNLNYLLKFVNEPYFTRSNVDKEKGIIAEEINMYKDMADYKLEMKLRECLYKNSPRRYDVGGSVEEINKITKEDLFKCYNHFYVPNNMFILIVGNFKVEEALETIKEVVENKPRKKLPTIPKIIEPMAVNVKECILKENIETPKIGFGVKISTKKLEIDNFELDLYLQMFTTMILGASSEFREHARNEKLYTGISLEWENIENFRTLYITANTTKPDELIAAIKEELKNYKLSKKTFERKKKVWIANEVKMIDRIHSTVNNQFFDIINYHDIIPDKIEKIRNMKIEVLKKILEQIDFKNYSIVKMIDNKEM